jgi:tetratricopeptide (TPR) repeat protein
MMYVAQFLDDESEEQYERVRTLWLQVLPELPSVWPALGLNVSGDPERGAAQLLQVPPVVNKSLVAVIKGLAAAVLGLGGKEDADDKIEQALRKHPEGTLYFLHAVQLSQKGRFSEARLQLTTALRAPTLGRIRRTCLRSILDCDVALAKRGNRLDPAALRQTVPIVAELLQLGPPRPDEAELCVLICLSAGDIDRAREVLKHWEARVGRDDPKAMVWRMRTEAQAGHHEAAIDAADRILKRDPNHADARKIRTEAVQALRDLLKRVGG